MYQIHPVGILALFAVTLCWSLAIVLYRTGHVGSVARKLALLMVVEGVTLISTGYIDLFLTQEARAHHLFPAWVKLEEIIHTLGDCAMLALYPPFLAAALQTKWTQPFAGRRMRIGITGVCIVLFFAVLMTPTWFGASLLYLALAVVFWFAFAASIHAWYLATGTARTRARSFALAFGVRDVCWGFVYGGAIWMIWFGQYHVVDPDASGPVYIVYAAGTLFAVACVWRAVGTKKEFWIAACCCFKKCLLMTLTFQYR